MAGGGKALDGTTWRLWESRHTGVNHILVLAGQVFRRLGGSNGFKFSPLGITYLGNRSVRR